MHRSKLNRITRLAIPAALVLAFTLTGSAQAASVVCEAVTAHSGVCEAWPQGSGFTYLWNTTGSAYLPTPAPDTASVRQLRCIEFYEQDGRVQVVVIAPDGSQSAVSALICRGRTEPVVPIEIF